MERVGQMEGLEGEDSPPDPHAINQHINPQHLAYNKKVISMKVLRWRFVQHKINRLLGVYQDYDNEKKLDLSNRIYSVFLQAMEYHPSASSTVGLGTNHSQHTYNI